MHTASQSSPTWRSTFPPFLAGAFLAIAALAALVMGGRPAGAQQGFAGEWDTSYGRMSLTQQGTAVAGTYVWDGQRSAIQGTVRDGRTLEFTYREASATGKGWFELTDDGSAFRGKWQQDGSRAWDSWVGKRPPAAEAASYAGLWNTTYGRMRLTQSGSAVAGIYDAPGGGAIDGTIDGKRLTFRYREANAEGEGWFELSGDGQGLRGQWRTGREPWKDWTGERVAPKSGIVWLVVLEANWEETMAESEYNFGSMLRQYFTRTPHVQVRHRFFSTEDDLRRWLAEVPYLAEPTVVVVSSHGTAKGVFGSASEEPIPAAVFGESLRYASNVTLLHLAACLTMKSTYPEDIMRSLGEAATFPVSGYATAVDWAGSALADLLYYEFLLVRGFPPARAYEETLSLLPLAGVDAGKSAAIPALDMRLVLPSSRTQKTAAGAGR